MNLTEAPTPLSPKDQTKGEGLAEFPSGPRRPGDRRLGRIRQKPSAVRVLRQVKAKGGGGWEGAAVERGEQCSDSSLRPLFRFAVEDLPPSTLSGLRFGGPELVSGSPGFGAFSAARRAALAPRGKPRAAPPLLPVQRAQYPL